MSNQETDTEFDDMKGVYAWLKQRAEARLAAQQPVPEVKVTVADLLAEMTADNDHAERPMGTDVDRELTDDDYSTPRVA